MGNLAKNSRGQSLIQVLVALAVAGIIIGIIVSIETIQANENRALTEKIAANDLARVITSVLSNGPACSLMFTSAGNIASGSLTFDSASVSAATPALINLNSIPTVGGPPAAVAGQLASNFSNSLKILAGTGIQVAVTGATTASLVVNFDQKQLMRPIHNLNFPILLQTGPAPTTITGCQSGSLRNWIDVSASRTAMTNYTNTTDHEIEVSASVYSGLGYFRCSVSIIINGVSVSSNFTNDTTTAQCSATATVPPGATYQVNNAIGPPGPGPGENLVKSWAELR
jgi:hypothetical protein